MRRHRLKVDLLVHLVSTVDDTALATATTRMRLLHTHTHTRTLTRTRHIGYG